ncbi:MAG: pro-sigmaK processing inhibitor BofA family protein [Defluviitaleaceae bacterium]|nr:pro-sigmaK processing inhibitor BofA family protein [Defluviitaleaceae bacterium]MCL2273740.1 pro-sigmaK processing inhibitor BofA family protein [Defluviitaleaceae bacterium]
MDTMMWVIIALCACFGGFLLYTRQFTWLLKVGRNMILGAAGILGANALLAGVGLAVGVNIITALIIGVLGIPGFMMLYLAQLLVG